MQGHTHYSISAKSKTKGKRGISKINLQIKTVQLSLLSKYPKKYL